MIKHLYIHLPFCKRICAYCDFTKRVSNLKIMEDYMKKLIEEIDFNKDNLKSIETIYIGGGTPSFYPYLESILKKIKEVVDISKVKEYTIESTLETVLDYKTIYHKYGINRISIGIESLNKDTLKYINRPVYSKESIKDSISELIKNNISNINFDLIYSLPYETIDSIKDTLDLIKDIKPAHISYYDLIVEDKTKLAYDLKNNSISLLDEDTNILMRDLINDSLIDMGYNHYEISNYALNGFESIHNLSYWDLDDYIGLGLNAHSLVNNKRYSNTDSLKEYLNSKNFNDIKNYYEFERCSEYFLMGLRKTKGVSLSKYIKIFNEDPIVKYNLKKHIDNHLLEIDGDYLRFTKEGINLGNIVFEEFV